MDLINRCHLLSPLLSFLPTFNGEQSPPYHTPPPLSLSLPFPLHQSRTNSPLLLSHSSSVKHFCDQACTPAISSFNAAFAARCRISVVLPLNTGDTIIASNIWPQPPEVSFKWTKEAESLVVMEDVRVATVTGAVVLTTAGVDIF